MEPVPQIDLRRIQWATSPSIPFWRWSYHYARVSTLQQSLNLQADALNRPGCKKLFTDNADDPEIIFARFDLLGLQFSPVEAA